MLAQQKAEKRAIAEKKVDEKQKAEEADAKASALKAAVAKKVAVQSALAAYCTRWLGKRRLLMRLIQRGLHPNKLRRPLRQMLLKG